MTALALALVAALSWGVSDLLGGLQARSVRLAVVLVVSMTAGVVTIGVVLALGRRLPELGPEVWFAVAAGPASVLALGLLYRAMATGPIVLVAPVAAAAAVVPVGWGLARGIPLSAPASVGIVAALGGATLAAWPTPEPAVARPPRAPVPVPALLCAAGAALAIGGWLVLVGYSSAHDPLWAAAVMRAAALGAAVVVLLARLRPGAAVAEVVALPVRALLLVALVGVSDMVAETAYALATTRATVGVVAVVASLYPAVTVLLAVVVLRERTRPTQRVGIGLALAGVLALAASS
jgi:uncharacterized membrane protein